MPLPSQEALRVISSQVRGQIRGTAHHRKMRPRPGFVVYQPDGRYWPFQGIGFAWLTVLALLLLAVTVWLVCRHGT